MTPDTIVVLAVYATIIHLLAIKGLFHFISGDHL